MAHGNFPPAHFSPSQSQQESPLVVSLSGLTQELICGFDSGVKERLSSLTAEALGEQMVFPVSLSLSLQFVLMTACCAWNRDGLSAYDVQSKPMDACLVQMIVCEL